jgi:hypothetical protein
MKDFQATGEHQAPQNMKILKFFLYLVGQFCLPGSASTTSMESGSNPKTKNWKNWKKLGDILPRRAESDSNS